MKIQSETIVTLTMSSVEFDQIIALLARVPNPTGEHRRVIQELQQCSDLIQPD